MFNLKIKKLRIYIHSKSGRNYSGKITIRHKVRGSKKLVLLKEVRSLFWNIPGIVISFDFDFRTRKWYNLISFHNGIIFYKLSSFSVGLGSILQSGYFAPILVGNDFYLKDISFNTIIHSVETRPFSSNLLITSSGCFGIFLFLKNNFCYIKLPSRKIITVRPWCVATLGRIFFTIKYLESFLKAGIKYRQGWRPFVRGVAMNPVDHPHGGGEGKTKGRFSVSIWGWLTK